MMRRPGGLLPLYLGACLVLGGASNAGFGANLALQLGAIALLVCAFWKPPVRPFRRVERRLVALVVLAGLVMAVQFLVLPDGLWELLPGRHPVASGIGLAGITPRWLTVSLAPHDSLLAVLWLLPALAMLAVMLRREPHHGRWLAVAIVLAMAMSVLVGALQITGDRRSALYFYEITNFGSTVGFFANSNHLASLLLVAIPFMAALAHDHHGLDPARRSIMLLLLGSLFLLDLAGIYANGSLAGYALVIPVSAASAMILFPASAVTRRWLPVLLLPLLGIGFTILLATKDGQALLAQGTGVSSGARDVIFSRTFAAIRDFFPVGTGVGTFPAVYPSYEPVHAIDWAHVNHAHNDYLEIVLETGLAGALLLAGFLLWWTRRAARLWTSRTANPYAMAGMIASGSLLVHSLVDYPLRTAALSSVMAACCALMTRWTAGDELPFETQRLAGWLARLRGQGRIAN